MIKIRYDLNSELELEGDDQSLSELRELMLKAEVNQETVIQVERNFDPSPYSTKLEELKVIQNDELLTIEVENKTLLIRGNKKCLEVLSDNFPINTESKPYHIHFDSIMFNEFMNEQSLDIIIGNND